MIDDTLVTSARPEPEPKPDIVASHRRQLLDRIDATPSRTPRPGPIRVALPLVAVTVAGIVLLAAGLVLVVGRSGSNDEIVVAARAENETATTSSQLTGPPETEQPPATPPLSSTPTTAPPPSVFTTTMMQSPVPVWLYPTDVGGDGPTAAIDAFVSEVLDWAEYSVSAPVATEHVDTLTATAELHGQPTGTVDFVLQRDSFGGGWVITAIGPPLPITLDDGTLSFELTMPPDSDVGDVLVDETDPGPFVEGDTANGPETIDTDGDGIADRSGVVTDVEDGFLSVSSAVGARRRVEFVFVTYRIGGRVVGAQAGLIEPDFSNGGRLGLALEARREAASPQNAQNDGPLVVESIEVDTAPTEAIPCQGAPASERPDNVGGDVTDGLTFVDPRSAVAAFLSGYDQRTLITTGYVEMIELDGSITYALEYGHGRTGYITLVSVINTAEGWTVDAWAASGC